LTSSKAKPACLALAVAAGVMLAGSACSGPQSTLDPAGPAAAAIATTWWWMLGGALLVWALVLGLLLRALLRGENTRALARPRRLIVAGGLVLPTVVLAALLVYGSVHSQRITGSGSDVELVVAVDARQWQWTFRYLDDAGATQATTIDALVLPRGRMVEFHVRSEDVIHGFWIPRLGGKIDAIPGRVNRLRLRADRAGAIRGQCAEFCGLGHARMAFDVRVLEPGAWEAWLRAQQAAAESQSRTSGGP
jgi:cytochrome c oxidase subunit 2